MTRRLAYWAMAAAGLTLAACSRTSPSMLDHRGSEARHIAGVWWLMFGLAAGVYAVVAAFIVVAVVRGRHTPGGRRSAWSDNGFIWVGGIVVPVLILALLAVVTVTSTRALRNPESGAVRIHVVGKRWWWAVEYPDDKIVTANEVHVPVGRPVEVSVDSDNVIHSFWVPQLAGKADTIPGQENVLRFRAERAGTYRGACAEYCGLQHAHMDFLVVADSPDAFDRWRTRHQELTATPSSEEQAQGQRVFMREACAGCHTIRGTQAQGTIGPDLTDFGSRSWIGAITVPNTTGFLSGWIANSQSIKPGNLMPPNSLSPSDLTAVVAYLQSLK